MIYISRVNQFTSALSWHSLATKKKVNWRKQVNNTLPIPPTTFNLAISFYHPRLWAGTRQSAIQIARTMTTSASGPVPSPTGSISSPATLQNDIPSSLTPPRKEKLHGRAFYESIGSPKFVLAPMVDQSEFVRPRLYRWRQKLIRYRHGDC